MPHLKYWLISLIYALLSLKLWFDSFKVMRRTGEYNKYKLLLSLLLGFVGWVFFWVGIFVSYQTTYILLENL